MRIETVEVDVCVRLYVPLYTNGGKAVERGRPCGIGLGRVFSKPETVADESCKLVCGWYLVPFQRARSHVNRCTHLAPGLHELRV